MVSLSPPLDARPASVAVRAEATTGDQAPWPPQPQSAGPANWKSMCRRVSFRAAIFHSPFWRTQRSW